MEGNICAPGGAVGKGEAQVGDRGGSGMGFLWKNNGLSDIPERSVGSLLLNGAVASYTVRCD